MREPLRTLCLMHCHSAIALAQIAFAAWQSMKHSNAQRVFAHWNA